MNRDEKAAVIDEVADRITNSQAIFAIDYRGLSVKQAVELRQQLNDADAHFQVVKNRLTIRSADKAGAEDLKAFLEGPTAFAFVQGDAAVAAKALATFRKQNGLLEFKGGTLAGEVLSIDQIESIAKLPARDVLHGQFVGVLASPITGLVRGLASMIGGLASQLQQIAEQGLVSGEAPAEEAAPASDDAPAEEAAPASEDASAARETASGEGAEPAAEEAPAGEVASASEDAPAEEPDASASDDAPAEEEAAPAEDASAAGETASGEGAEPAAEEAAPEGDGPAEDTPAEEAPGSPVAEAETAEQEEASGDAPEGDAPEETTDTPSEGDTEQEG